MASQDRFSGQEESLKLLFPSSRLKHLLKMLTTEQHQCSSIRLTCCAWRYHTPPSSHHPLRIYTDTAPVSQPERMLLPALPAPHPPQHCCCPTGQLEGAGSSLGNSHGKHSKDQIQLGEGDATLSSRTLFTALNNLRTLQQLHL